MRISAHRKISKVGKGEPAALLGDLAGQPVPAQYLCYLNVNEVWGVHGFAR